MKHNTDMGSCATIYIPSFITTGSSNEDLQEGIPGYKGNMDVISLVSFFFFSKIRKDGQKLNCKDTQLKFHG
jgi:hypothetical protein